VGLCTRALALKRTCGCRPSLVLTGRNPAEVRPVVAVLQDHLNIGSCKRDSNYGRLTPSGLKLVRSADIGTIQYHMGWSNLAAFRSMIPFVSSFPGCLLSTGVSLT